MKIERKFHISPEEAVRLFKLTEELATSFVPEQKEFHKVLGRVLTNPHALLCVASSEGCPIGYCLAFYHPALYANGNVAWIEEVIVTKKWRGKGIGTLLIEEVESWAKENSCNLIALATRRAGEFYKELGYCESAVYFKKTISGTTEPI